MTTWVDAGRYGRLCREITNEIGSRAICHVWTRQNARHKTKDGSERWLPGEANFALILKAPQMLEALEKIAALDPAFWCEIPEEGIVAVCNQCKEIARAAIAAVKGEETKT